VNSLGLLRWANYVINELNTTKIESFNGGINERFFEYSIAFSNIMKSLQGQVNLCLVGACDGTEDPLINNIYIPQHHWNGLFIEAVASNINDLKTFVVEKDIENRTFLLHAALSPECINTTIQIKERIPLDDPDAEKEVPHWKKKQLSTIARANYHDNELDKYKLVDVDCKTAANALDLWSSTYFHYKKTQLHILQIDVEGLDAELLRGFIQTNTPLYQYPLLIMFESKHLQPGEYESIKKELISKGYIVSKDVGDTLAVLRGEVLLKRLKKLKVISSA
jgi:hypothetical protein